MTVITITAVGYSEVRPLSELGRSFTMALLAAGITRAPFRTRLDRGWVSSRRAHATGCSHPTGDRLDRYRAQERKDEAHQFVFNPVADTRLETGDEMIVLGQPDQVARLRKYAGA